MCRVALELLNQRNGRKIKAGRPMPKASGYQSAATDFCNEIGTKRTSPAGRAKSVQYTGSSGRDAKPTRLNQLRILHRWSFNIVQELPLFPDHSLLNPPAQFVNRF